MHAAETVPAPAVSRPQITLPAGACDAHSHVFGPFDRFPPREASVYALPLAGPDVHARMRSQLGIARGVLVQPAPYASDPAAMLDAIQTSNGALKGIAVADATVSDATLEHWKTQGIVGLRFAEMRAPGGGRYPGSVGFDALEVLAPRMRAIGLHAQVWASSGTLAEKLPRLSKLGLPIVIDHCGMPDVAPGVDGADVGRLISHLVHDDVHVKLSICRVSRQPWPHDDVRRLHDALVAAAPAKCLWGSDWPYVRMSPAPDAGRLLDLLSSWTDSTVKTRILVDNPARIYGFER